jgi:hypothetical protein
LAATCLKVIKHFKFKVNSTIDTENYLKKKQQKKTPLFWPFLSFEVDLLSN